MPTDVEKLSILDDDPFLALKAFRHLTAVERQECLFLKLFGLGRDCGSMERHLGMLNGSVATTSNLVAVHLEMHKGQTQASEGIKVFGGRLRIVAMYAVGAVAAGLGVVLSALQVIEHLR